MEVEGRGNHNLDGVELKRGQAEVKEGGGDIFPVPSVSSNRDSASLE